MNARIAIGLLVMFLSEGGALARIEPFWSWNTPICWTGFILFADAVVWQRRGDSWLRSAPREFAALAVLSIPLWLVFEFFNLFIRNWYYVGLPENPLLRTFGYAWSFATIWPAICEGADLVSVARGAPATPDIPAASRTGDGHALPALSIVVGTSLLIWPLAASPALARYLAAPVWLGFIFLLDPITAWLGGPSLTRDWRSRQFDRTINLALSGVLCGVLWEFWNYWSQTKWRYSLPIMEHMKIFEMPLPGYLGFPALALECFTMYAFVRTVWLRTVGSVPTAGRGRAIAL